MQATAGTNSAELAKARYVSRRRALGPRAQARCTGEQAEGAEDRHGGQQTEPVRSVNNKIQQPSHNDQSGRQRQGDEQARKKSHHIPFLPWFVPQALRRSGCSL